jgi:hypothetical protein
MCEKLADHKTTVYVHMFNSCFHLEPVSQDIDILELNLCTPHYKKWNKSIKIMKLCSHAIYIYIYEKTTSNKRSVTMPISKIDLFSVYLNHELNVEKEVFACKAILCLTCSVFEIHRTCRTLGHTLPGSCKVTISGGPMSNIIVVCAG